MLRSRHALSFRVRLVLLLIVFAALGSCGEDPTLAGMVRDPLPEVGEVVLPDVSDGGRGFATRAAEDRLLVLYFGYTSCPDICPTTLADLRQALGKMGGDADRVDVAMVTVDPIRDDPERLTHYVQSFFDDAHALRTDDWSVLESAARTFGASYEVKQTAEGEIEVSHSAFLYAIDPAGQVLVQWPFGMSSEDIAGDLSKLLKR